MLSLNELTIELTRSSRRRLCIYIHEGKVSVAAPMRMSEEKIKEFVEQKLSWIKKTVEKQAQRPQYQKKEYTQGEIFQFLGQEYALDLMESVTSMVQLKKDSLCVSLGANAAMAGNKVWIHRQLLKWYVQQALEHLENRTHYFAQQLNLRYQSIKVKYYKSKWGSCSIQGHIQYNYLLILAPPMIVDYIVVHELSHLKHHNHSPQFWQLVATLIPNYQECRRWLKDWGNLLRID